MSKTKILKDLVDQLCSAVPTNLGGLKKDFEKNCHSILMSTFNKFDLVTREEFDTQSKVLLRTRKKLTELEKQVEVLETALKTRRRKDTDGK